MPAISTCMVLASINSPPPANPSCPTHFYLVLNNFNPNNKLFSVNQGVD